MTTPSHRFEQRGGIDVLTWPALDGLPVDAVVTSRHGGVSAGSYASLNLGLHVGDDPQLVVTNRERAAACIGLTLDDLVFCRQAHDRGVIRVDHRDRGRGVRSDADAVPHTDALVTTDPRVGLAIMVADCVPVVLVSGDAGVLAGIHAGWRGTTRRVVDGAVAAMEELGAGRSSIHAALGPAIPAARYQVGADVLAAAEEAFGDRAGELVMPDDAGRWTFDLWAANIVALLDSGLEEDRVSVAGIGTGQGTPFFSDRQERPCGRFATIARLTSSA